MITFQKKQFKEEYRKILNIEYQPDRDKHDFNKILKSNGMKALYVDPDCRDDNVILYYDLLTKFLDKREQTFKNDFTFIPPGKAEQISEADKHLDVIDKFKIVVRQKNKTIFRLTSDQFGFTGYEQQYIASDGYFNYPLARVNHLSREKSPEEREQILDKLIHYVENTRTLGSAFVWPIHKSVDRRCQYNINRGVKNYIADRVDLTLLEIKHILDKKQNQGTNLLKNSYNKEKHMKKWLDHFASFDDYVEYFMFESFVKDGMPINIFTGEPFREDEIDACKNRIFQIKNLKLDELLSMMERLESMIFERTESMERYLDI